MPTSRPNRLVRDLRTLEERIENVLASARGNHVALRRRLYLELLCVLNGTGGFDQIPECIPSTGGLTARIERQIGAAGNHTLPRAIYESEYYAKPIEPRVASGEIHGSEWEFLSRLARRLNVAPGYGLEYVDEPQAWMIDVDETYRDVRVWIRELALQDMLLAAMETFLVPGGAGIPSSEIYGIVFGTHRESARRGRARQKSLLDVNVERVCIQQRAKGTPSEVVADERSEATQLALAEELFPFWQLLGDFHTHTYRSLSELIRVNGWNYSRHDERQNIIWCENLRSMGHRPRVALILALTRAERQRAVPKQGWNGMPNVIRATLGRCHCFFAAYRIRADGRYSHEGIELRCPHLAGR